MPRDMITVITKRAIVIFFLYCFIVGKWLSLLYGLLTFRTQKGNSGTRFIICYNFGSAFQHGLPPLLKTQCLSLHLLVLLPLLLSILPTVLCTNFVVPEFLYPILRTDGIWCNSVFIDFGGISLIVTNGFILDKNNISD